MYSYINYNAWRKLAEACENYISRILIHLKLLRSLARISFPALFYSLFYTTFISSFTSLKMRKTLKVENRCCSWTLILFMCVFSLIFFPLFLLAFPRNSSFSLSHSDATKFIRRKPLSLAFPNTHSSLLCCCFILYSGTGKELFLLL